MIFDFPVNRRAILKAASFAFDGSVKQLVQLAWGHSLHIVPQEARLDPGVLVFFLELKPGADPREAEAAFYQQLDRIAQEGLPERELQRAKNNLKAHVLDELSTNASRASALGNWEIFLGGWRSGFDLAERYASITSEQCQAAAARYFDPKRRSVVALVPEAAQGNKS